MDLGVCVREAEGGVGPAVGVEDPPGHSLHVAGDRVSHQLDGRDQQTASQEQPGSDLRIVAKIIITIVIYLYSNIQ